MKTKKIKIMDLVVDPELQIREINSFTIAEYRESMRSGNIFPTIIIDGKNRIICGHHRVYAYKGIHEPDYKIDCQITDLKTDADLIMLAASDNSKHGRPLTTFEKKTTLFRLKEKNIDIDKISSVLGVTIGRIEQWAGLSVTVIGGDKSIERPVKKGSCHLVGQTVNAKDYESMKRVDYGVSVGVLAKQIISIMHRENKWIKDPQILKELYFEIKNYFTNKGEVL
jgi:hypothetical protein